MNKKILENEIISVEKKINKINGIIEKREAKVKADNPGVNTLCLETIQDWIELSQLYGERKAFIKIKNKLGVKS